MQLFELIQIVVECCKIYFRIFSLQETGAFGSKIEEEPQKQRPKLKKVCYIFGKNICFVCNLM